MRDNKYFLLLDYHLLHSSDICLKITTIKKNILNICLISFFTRYHEIIMRLLKHGTKLGI